MELLRTFNLNKGVNPYMMSFAEKILTARTELGMTQKQLAEATDLSLRTILAYEKGEKSPRASTMLKLAKALKVSVSFCRMTNALILSRILKRTAISRRLVNAMALPVPMMSIAF